MTTESPEQKIRAVRKAVASLGFALVNLAFNLEHQETSLRWSSKKLRRLGVDIRFIVLNYLTDIEEVQQIIAKEQKIVNNQER